MTHDFNGFPDSHALAAARQLLDQAREFPQAEPGIRGLDAYCSEQNAPTRIDASGVHFAPARAAEFASGIAGPIGRHLLKSAMACKPEKQSPPPTKQPHSEQPAAASPPPATIADQPAALCAPQAPQADSARPDLLLASSFPAAPSSDPFEGVDDFDLTEIDEQDDYEIEPYELLPRQNTAPVQAAPLAPAAPPMSLSEIKAMMGRASGLPTQAPDPVSAAVESALREKSAFVFVSERWEAKAGVVKKAARSAAAPKGLRLEIDPPESLCGPAVCALFAIDPGEIPAPSSPEALAQPEFEESIKTRLREALRSAQSRGQLCGSWLAVVSGWGERAEIARAEVGALARD